MLYFIDESGIDLKESPCMVLTAVSISEEFIWDFINEMFQLKKEILAMETLREVELKGNKLLKKKKFRLAKSYPQISKEERYRLLTDLYKKNKNEINPTRKELTAIGQASIEFVEMLLSIAEKYNVKVFSTVFPRDGKNTKGSQLRKDYSYLFERIHLHLQCTSPTEKGIIVFDEIEKKSARRLINQMRKYFLHTHTGRQRSKHIIPEPFFVHSDLTSLTQLADIIAYIINWGYRDFATEQRISRTQTLKTIKKFSRKAPVREELKPFADTIYNLQFHCSHKDNRGNERLYFGIKHIDDLRTRYEKMGLNADEIEKGNVITPQGRQSRK